MKYTTVILKTEIVKYLKANPGVIASQYDSGEGPDETKLYSEKIWRRTMKEKEESRIRRDFEIKEACMVGDLEWAEFLRVEVFTDATDTQLLSICVEND